MKGNGLELKATEANCRGSRSGSCERANCISGDADVEHLRQHHASDQEDCRCIPALDRELMGHFGPAPSRVEVAPWRDKRILDRIQKYVHPFRVTKGKGFQLKDFDPGDTRGLKLDKGEAAELLQRGTEWLAEEQDMLYAQNRWSLLLVFQAMDAAGKDSTIKHVMSGVNPQGCQVVSFKQPTSEDLDHDFMWRYMRRLPERGRIGIFNRSYYEEVLLVRVHEEILKRQPLPSELVGKRFGKSVSRTSRILRITSPGPTPPRLEIVSTRWGRCGSAIAARRWPRSRPDKLTANDAIARVDAVTRLEALARQAWRSAAHLGAGGE